MTNNTDDFEQHDNGLENEEFPTKGGMRANLAHAWRSQPLIKLMVLFVVVAAIAAVSFTLFSGSENAHTNTTSLAVPPVMHEAPGGQASAYVKEQTKLADKQREEDAAKKGTSNLPTPMGGDFAEPKRDDTLNELKSQIENLTRIVNTPKPQPQQQPQAAARTAQPEEFDESLAKAMQREMNDLSAGWAAHGIKRVDVSLGTSEIASSAASAAVAAAANAPALQSTSSSKIIVPAGTVSYAQLLTQANSDVPGPILAQIVSGPLAGARVVGSFQTENAYAEYLVLRFTLAELKGKEYHIDTIALDPDTSLGGMATEVDERYFERIILPSAAAFLQGFGGALGSPGSTTSTNGTTTIVSQSGSGLQQGAFQGVSQAAQTAGQFFQNQANQTKPLIMVAAGTPMGLMFVTSLKETSPDQFLNRAGNASGYGLPMNGNPQGYDQGYGQGYGSGYPQGYPQGYPNQAGNFANSANSPYPGTTVSGYGANGYNSNTSSGVPYPNYGAPANRGTTVTSPFSNTSYIH